MVWFLIRRWDSSTFTSQSKFQIGAVTQFCTKLQLVDKFQISIKLPNVIFPEHPCSVSAVILTSPRRMGKRKK
jgi:hypothetical protein